MTSHEDEETRSSTDPESAAGPVGDPVPVDSEDALPFPWIGILVGIALFVVVLLYVLAL